MKRTQYNVRMTAGDVRPVSGYTFAAGGFRFGVSDVGGDGSRLGFWLVSELTSGAALTGCGRLCDAPRAVLDVLRRRGVAAVRAAASAFGDVNAGLVPASVYWLAL